MQKSKYEVTECASSPNSAASSAVVDHEAEGVAARGGKRSVPPVRRLTTRAARVAPAESSIEHKSGN